MLRNDEPHRVSVNMCKHVVDVELVVAKTQPSTSHPTLNSARNLDARDKDMDRLAPISGRDP